MTVKCSVLDVVAGSVVVMTYRRRLVDDLLDDVFPHLAAIAVEGAKGVGKTATAAQRAASTVNLSLAGQRSTVAASPGYVTTLAAPVFIDEWQLEPRVWDVVRNAVDADRSGGQYLLAGSAGLAPNVRVHSGAGRIIRVTMRPLSLVERGLAAPTVSLSALLAGTGVTVEGRSDIGLTRYVDEILASGFPGIRDLPERPRQLQLDSYLARIVDRELPENGIEVRRPDVLRQWLQAYAAATSTDTAYGKILDAATPGESDKPARGTVIAYREHLTRIFVLDPVEAWLPTFNPLKRLTRTAKHHLVDPALAARLVGVSRAGLLRGEGRRISGGAATWVGALFESLATQSIRVYAEAANARVGHLRTHDTTREIDLIVEGEDRRVVAIEVKLADAVSDSDVQHLNWLASQVGDDLADRVVVYTGEFAYRRPDGVAVVPLALLGP